MLGLLIGEGRLRVINQALPGKRLGFMLVRESMEGASGHEVWKLEKQLAFQQITWALQGCLWKSIGRGWVDFSHCIRCVMGDGSKIRFWYDEWSDDQLEKCFPRVILKCLFNSSDFVNFFQGDIILLNLCRSVFPQTSPYIRTCSENKTWNLQSWLHIQWFNVCPVPIIINCNIHQSFFRSAQQILGLGGTSFHFNVHRNFDGIQHIVKRICKIVKLICPLPFPRDRQLSIIQTTLR